MIPKDIMSKIDDLCIKRVADYGLIEPEALKDVARYILNERVCEWEEERTIRGLYFLYFQPACTSTRVLTSDNKRKYCPYCGCKIKEKK